VRGILIPREKIVARRRDRVARVLHSFSLGVFLYINPQSYVVRVSLSSVIALHSVPLHNSLVRVVRASLVFIASYYEFALAHICHRAIYDDIIQRKRHA
jgi:hypothetical protein